MDLAAIPAREPGAASDSLLATYLTSADQRASDEALRVLLERDAAPVIRRVLYRQSGGSQAGSAEMEDVGSAAREQLLGQLTALRSGERETPIANFESYVASVTYSAWAGYLREQYPQRSMLLNRVRYLLENRTNQRGFAIWDGTSGERWCGLARWRDEPRRIASTPKAQWLVLDPIGAARAAFGGGHLATITLPEFVAGMFRWLGSAIELRTLVDVAAVALELSDEKVVADSECEAASIAASSVSPVDSLKWHEYLQWLFGAVATLSLPQRTAFLLHSNVTIELDFAGVASIRQIAGLLAMPIGELAQLWKSIPLDDLTIASRLGLQRQQVINHRRAAREHLGAALAKMDKRGGEPITARFSHLR